MGKVIRFPASSVRRPGRAKAVPFQAFGELANVERAQLRLFTVCCAGATAVLAAALQVVGLGF